MLSLLQVFFQIFFSQWLCGPQTSAVHQNQLGSLFSSVQSLSLCDRMDCSMPGFPVHHQLPELAQTHVHRVVDVIKPRSESLLNVLGTTLRISDSASLGWEARDCVYNRFPGVALAAGPESILWESLVFAIYKSLTFVYS